MSIAKQFLKSHWAFVVLMGIIVVLTAIPFLEIFFVLGNSWQGILPNLSDELNFARVHTIGEGHVTDGNPYFLEHSDGAPLTFFGGAWLNAIPLLAGIPFTTALAINFILWSLLFACALNMLFRELHVSPWVAVLATVFLYLQLFTHVWRPVNLQPVYPFCFLFYFALMRFIREQNRTTSILLGCVTGATFYLYAYLWQIAVVTLGLLFLYALAKHDRVLLKATFLSTLIGTLIGLPTLLYILWLSKTSPFYWESMGRLGLVDTHLPMAEIIYSGGWIGVVLLLATLLLWRSRTLRADKEFVLLSIFIFSSGLGIWIMQGSNLVTGKLLETGEHVAGFIMPWIIFCLLSLGTVLLRLRAQLSRTLQVVVVFAFVLLVLFSLSRTRSSLFTITDADRASWKEDQLYAKPFAWLEEHEASPVVVWSNPNDKLTANLPIFTKHFTLYHFWGILELVPESEVRERYLVSQYFNTPTASDLQKDAIMAVYLGRHDFPHQAKTIERGIKICRVLFFWDADKDCGTPPTSQQLLGEKFFTDLETRFKTDIVPNIKTYLAKYHVAYILKDKVLDPQYHPEILGAVRVYADDRYEIYHLK